MARTRILVGARKLTYNKKDVCEAFKACGIWPLNSRKILDAPSRMITRPVTPPPQPLLPTTPKKARDVGRLGRDTLSLIKSSSPRSQRIRIGIEKLVKFGERADAKHDIEAFRHSQLRKQVKRDRRNRPNDRRVLSRARLIDNTSLVRLREERLAKEKS